MGAKMASRGRYVGHLVRQVGQLEITLEPRWRQDGAQVAQLGAQDSQLGGIFGSKLAYLGRFQKPLKTSYQEKAKKY